MPRRVSPSFQARRALLRSLAPRYQQASPAQKTLLLDSFVEWTGYTRKYAIELLNHGEHGQQTIQRHRSPQYVQAVQQALFLTWKAAYYVCAKRLLPSLPTLVTSLEQRGHLCLTEEERRQLLAMSLSTAERFLRTQRKPRLHGLSATTPSSSGKFQSPLRTFSEWDEDRPGFVEMDLVAHCGDHLDGRFLYTLTLTDLATGWTECLPLLEKSADAVLAALAQARTLFPFPLLGIDTDSGSEFLNAEVIAYCEQEQLTFTRGRPGVKNDQCHVEQKNGAVVRRAVGCARLVGAQAYLQLREVGAALSLDQGKNEVFSDGFCTSDALCLCGSVDLEIFAEEAKDNPWLSIRQAHNNDGLAIKYERLLLDRMKILLFVQCSPRRGNVCGITLFTENGARRPRSTTYIFEAADRTFLLFPLV